MTSKIAIEWRDRAVDIEYQWIDGIDADFVIVFLHEGLGSVAMWKDFPHRLCARLGACGLVYSRPGYGASTPRASDETWGNDFMHRQATEVLPALLAALKIQACPWLLGHSDGASIALLYAAAFPESLAGAIVLAPHIFVEDLSIASIEKVRTLYRDTPMRAKLARYHDDVDSAFYGWNDIWLNPSFRQWTIENDLDTIRCPLLAVQGLDDEYGTLDQIDGIARHVPHTELFKLAACGHSSHVDQPDALIDVVKKFIEDRRQA